MRPIERNNSQVTTNLVPYHKSYRWKSSGYTSVEPTPRWRVPCSAISSTFISSLWNFERTDGPIWYYGVNRGQALGNYLYSWIPSQAISVVCWRFSNECYWGFWVSTLIMNRQIFNKIAAWIRMSWNRSVNQLVWGLQSKTLLEAATCLPSRPVRKIHQLSLLELGFIPPGGALLRRPAQYST